MLTLFSLPLEWQGERAAVRAPSQRHSMRSSMRSGERLPVVVVLGRRCSTIKRPATSC